MEIIPAPLEAPMVEITVSSQDEHVGEFVFRTNNRLDEPAIIKDNDLRSLDTQSTATATADESSLISAISDSDFLDFSQKVKWWDRKKKYSDLIQEGLAAKNAGSPNVVMLFESPSSSTPDSSFYNSGVYRFHDWPPVKYTRGKEILGPCRYSLMNGSNYPVYLRNAAPTGLVEHWADAVPGFTAPTFKHEIAHEDTVYAYLPCEEIKEHVNDPSIHFHLVGKDSIHLMTQKTTKMLHNTKDVRPCIAKTTHSMGSKGIFVIRNDEDEAEFEQFLRDSGNPSYVVTEFVDIARNVACHFFMHPDGRVTWLGSNENHRKPDGSFSSDSYLLMEEQEVLKEMQLPYVEDVVRYCMSLGFWGFCGIDVLFDYSGKGFLVDVNPRLTGSCPALMTLQLLREEYEFKFGLFRRGGNINFYGDADDLMAQVKAFNDENVGHCRVVIHSYYQRKQGLCRVNIGVYGHDLDSCTEILNRFAQGSSTNRSGSAV